MRELTTKARRWGADGVTTATQKWLLGLNDAIITKTVAANITANTKVAEAIGDLEAQLSIVRTRDVENIEELARTNVIHVLAQLDIPNEPTFYGAFRILAGLNFVYPGMERFIDSSEFHDAKSKEILGQNRHAPKNQVKALLRKIQAAEEKELTATDGEFAPYHFPVQQARVTRTSAI